MRRRAHPHHRGRRRIRTGARRHRGRSIRACRGELADRTQYARDVRAGPRASRLDRAELLPRRKARGDRPQRHAHLGDGPAVDARRHRPDGRGAYRRRHRRRAQSARMARRAGPARRDRGRALLRRDRRRQGICAGRGGARVSQADRRHAGRPPCARREEDGACRRAGRLGARERGREARGARGRRVPDREGAGGGGGDADADGIGPNAGTGPYVASSARSSQ